MGWLFCCHCFRLQCSDWWGCALKDAFFMALLCTFGLPEAAKFLLLLWLQALRDIIEVLLSFKSGWKDVPGYHVHCVLLVTDSHLIRPFLYDFKIGKEMFHLRELDKISLPDVWDEAWPDEASGILKILKGTNISRQINIWSLERNKYP